VNFLAETTAGFVVMVNEWLLPVASARVCTDATVLVAIDARQHRCAAALAAAAQIAA
jgi:hypothetical protein